MKQSLDIIHVEDSLEDSELIKVMLQSTGMACETRRVETRDQLVNALLESNCDLILSDCTLPQFHGLEALYVARAMKPEIPFIFVSGTIGEETAIKSLQNGATDYVLKQRLSRLIPAVRRALTEAEGRKARKALEGQLHQAKKLETIGTLAGGLAHDFRNLLHILTLNIDLLTMISDDPHVIEIADKLGKTTQRGCGMMQELLVFARRAEANLLPINITHQIKELASLLQPSLPANVSLFLKLEEDLPSVPAERGQVDRMLTNLIMNARDAMPQGGEIVLSADLVRLDQTHADLWEMKDVPYLRLQVSDTGTGMSDLTQAHIFEPFYTTKPEGKGTGLGLSVVFGLMKAHNGFIDLQSQPEAGSAFSLFFPLSAETTIEPDRLQVITPTRLLGKTNEREASL